MYSTNCFQINHKPNSQHVDCVHVLVLYMTQLCDNTYKCTVRVQYVISFRSTVRAMMYKYSTSTCTYKVYSCTTSMINNFKQTFYNTRLYSYMYMLQCEDVRNTVFFTCWLHAVTYLQCVCLQRIPVPPFQMGTPNLCKYHNKQSSTAFIQVTRASVKLWC